MIIPAPFSKILAIFRGGVSPVIIFLTITLGFWFGLVPGWSGFHTLIIALVFVLNIHIGFFLFFVGVGKGLCFAAAPVLYHVGQAVQTHLPGLLNALAAIPIIGITDFSNYSVAGAIVTGPIIGGIAGLLMARSVIGFRRMLLKLEEGSEQFKKWHSNRWVYILDRILIGKRTKDAKSLFSAKAKIIRKAGVAVAVLILAVSAGAVWFAKGDVTRNYAATTLTRANGAEVNLGSLELSPLNGAVSASQIQVTDAKQPENNQVAIEKVAADASVYDLLLGRLILENVEVSNVQFGQKRATPGKVLETAAEQQQPFDPCDYKITTADINKLETYFKDAKALKEKLQKLRQWLPKAKEGQAPTTTTAEQTPQKYLDYLKARAAVPPSPRLLAKKVLVDKIQIPSAIFGGSEVLLTNLSDSAATAGLPVTLDLKSHDTSAAVNATMDYSSKGEAPKFSGTFAGIDLSKMQSGLGGSNGIVFESGTASGTFDGYATNESIDVALHVKVSDMKAGAQGNGVLGLGSETTSEALKVLNSLETTIRIVGPITEPRLVFDVKGLQDEFKNALVKAGKQKLADEVNKQVDKQLGDKASPEIKDAVEKSKGLIDGLLGGKK